MEQRITCKGCGQVVKVAAKPQGTVAKCPQCGGMLLVPPTPAAETAASAAAASPVATTVSQAARVAPPPLAPSEVQVPTAQQKAMASIRSLMEAGKSSFLVADLRTLDFKSEVLPLSQQSIGLLRTDFVFWSVSLLAIVPLLLVTLNHPYYQMTGFCLFFAAIWGVIFKKFVIEESAGWLVPLGALFFTGLIGINLLLEFHKVLPKFYQELANSENIVSSLIGFVTFVGLWEEMFKMLPVFIYLAWKRRAAAPLTIILVGAFSGLGFAAFENLMYAARRAAVTEGLSRYGGSGDVQMGVHVAMIEVLLRSISLVFLHAVFSGIFAYFIALGWITQRRRLALGLVGWSVVALLHGSYDWIGQVQATLPAPVAAFSFMLFYAYLTKLRLVIAAAGSAPSVTPQPA
jgi:RsiW-degrading membrane proteinase PrsW (M82 family)